jgi:xanthine dehydrogenase YagS FAD-binding subunit
MINFTYYRPDRLAQAIGGVASTSEARFIAGGTNLLDLMKINVMRPRHLIDLNRLPLRDIRTTANGGLSLGALATNAETAYHPEVRTRYPLLSEAILSGASAQLRNMATNGGNLLQRTRCYYFYDTATPCNKRTPGAGCSALEGYNRIHAILGTSKHCIATHPSDMCVALSALDAVIQVTGKNGERAVPIEEFHRLPGDTPHIDANLNPDEIITSIELPANGFAQHSTYLKLRDRASYAFALVSVAAAMDFEPGKMANVRLALGGVAHKPWRDERAESLLNGKAASSETFLKAANVLLKHARSYGHNEFKIEMTRRAIVRGLELAAAGRATHL